MTRKERLEVAYQLVTEFQAQYPALRQTVARTLADYYPDEPSMRHVLVGYCASRWPPVEDDDTLEDVIFD